MLLSRHWNSIADLSNHSDGRPRRWARGILYGAPFVAGVLSWPLHLDLTGVAGSLVAGFALIAGGLIAVFVQLAIWRNRLDDRAGARPESEAPARRTVDAAAAHCLVGVLAAVTSLVIAVVLQGIAAPDHEPFLTVRTVLTGVLMALSTFVVGLFFVIVSSVFVVYESNVDGAVRDMDNESLRPETRLRVAGEDERTA